MSVFVVILKCGKLISVKSSWLKTTRPTCYTKSLVFFSPNNQDVPDFGLEQSYYFQPTIPACYESRVVKEFGKFFEKRILFVNK